MADLLKVHIAPSDHWGGGEFHSSGYMEFDRGLELAPHLRSPTQMDPFKVYGTYSSFDPPNRI
jgi:hypothetical protein